MATTIVLVADALDLAVTAAQTLSTVMPIIQQAQAEGRTTLTAAEWATITAGANAADTKFDADLAAGAAKGT